MSFLIKGMVINRRALLSAVVFPAFIVSWSGTFLGMVVYMHFGTFDLPLYYLPFGGAAYAVVVFMGGFLLDRFRRRKLFFLLFFVWAIVEFLPIIFKTGEMALIHFFALRIAYAAIYPAAYSFLADHTEIYERGRVAGLAWSGVGLLWIILSLSALNSLDLYFALQGAFAAAGGLIGVFVVKEKVITDGEWRKVPTRSILSDRNFLLYAVAIGIIALFWSSNIVLVLNYSSGVISNPSLVWGFMIPSIYVVSSFFVGFLTDRVGRRPVLIIGALLIASSFMVFTLFREFWILLLTTVFFGVGLACTWIPGSLVVFGDLARKESRGRYYGMGMACVGVGGMVGSAAAVSLVNAPAAVVMTFTLFIAFMIVFPVIMARETLPPKERIEEMYDYIKEIEKETGKNKDESPN